MDVKKGQIVTLKPEFLGPGETDPGPHIALEDSFRGTVKVEAVDGLGLTLKPVNVWRTEWIGSATDAPTERIAP